jgi:hypothetical protein
MVDRRPGQVGAGSDFFEGGGVVTHLAEDFPGGADDTLPGLG